MTDEKIRVQIVASASEALVQTVEHGKIKTVGHKGVDGWSMPDYKRFSEETKLAMRESAHTAMIEAERLENQLNAPPEPPAPTLREAAEEARRLLEDVSIPTEKQWSDTIAMLKQALDAEGGGE